MVTRRKVPANATFDDAIGKHWSNSANLAQIMPSDRLMAYGYTQPVAGSPHEDARPRPVPRGGRPEAADAIWHWRERRASTTPDAATSRARAHGAVRALLGAAIGALLWTMGLRVAAGIALCISTLVLALALALPARLERWTALLARGIGTLSTWVLMTAIFCGFFLPFRMIARRGRRDAMKRYFDRDAPTYWEKRADAPLRHERPF